VKTSPSPAFFRYPDFTFCRVSEQAVELTADILLFVPLGLRGRYDSEFFEAGVTMSFLEEMPPRRVSRAPWMAGRPPDRTCGSG
jgi:hypothetical protein